MISYPNYHQAIESALIALKVLGKEIHTEKWQGIGIADSKSHEMWELMEHSFKVTETPAQLWRLQKLIRPNLPWAEDHFQERVAGQPLNPGEQYKNWPPYKNNPSNDKFRTEKEKFSHTYMERYWPKQAGQFEFCSPKGIRYEYGDLLDVINLLHKEPNTRQAFLPVWFPEDTGAIHGGRVPCTLGYWFYMRDNKLNVVYYIRACDAIRHFRDDVYLTVRLTQWILEQLRTTNFEQHWMDVQVGSFTMHIGSFHVFAKERNLL